MDAVVAAASMRTHTLMESTAEPRPLGKDAQAHLDNLVVETAAVLHRLKETDPKHVSEALGEMRRNNALAAILADELLASAQAHASNGISAEVNAATLALEASPVQEQKQWKLFSGWFAKKNPPVAKAEETPAEETQMAEETPKIQPQQQIEREDVGDAYSVADSDVTRSESVVDTADFADDQGFKPLEVISAFFHRNAREPKYETEFTYGSECGYAQSVTSHGTSAYELPPARVLPAITVENGDEYEQSAQASMSDNRLDAATKQRVEQYLTSTAAMNEASRPLFEQPGQSVEEVVTMSVQYVRQTADGQSITENIDMPVKVIKASNATGFGSQETTAEPTVSRASAQVNTARESSVPALDRSETRYRTVLVPRVKYEPLEIDAVDDVSAELWKGPDALKMLDASPFAPSFRPTPVKLFDEGNHKSILMSGDSASRDSGLSSASTLGNQV